MTVSSETEAEITRLFGVEHWRIGTIATQLGVHEDVVRRVLGIVRKGQTDDRPKDRPPALLSPFVAFIKDTLERYPRLRSTRVHDMLVERGYRGSPRSVRRYVKLVRPRGVHEAFLRLDPLCAEEAQIDWAHVGHVPVPGGGSRSLWLFIMVLSWSRAMWGEFCFDTTVHSLLRSLVRGCSSLGGSPRRWLFDNPKIVVLERDGAAVRFHPLLLHLAGVFKVQLRLCGPYRGNEKGRVERKIRFLRDRFLAGRDIHSIEQGNCELADFIAKIAHQQAHPAWPTRTIADCLDEEQSRLLPLPAPLPATDVVEPVLVDKTAFIRFDTNLYSVPPEHVQKTVTLVADDTRLRILDGVSAIAEHPRSWGRRQKIESREHRDLILRSKPGATPSAGRDRLRAAAPEIDIIYTRWVDLGRNVGSMAAQTARLLQLYGQDVFQKAIAETVERGTHDPGEIGVLCEKYRRAAEHPIPIDVPLSEGIPDRDVIPHNLGDYDADR
jgi:transposase